MATGEAAPREAPKPRIKTFEIYRWNPDTPEKKPEMVKYDIDLNQTVGRFTLPCGVFHQGGNGGVAVKGHTGGSGVIVVARKEKEGLLSGNMRGLFYIANANADNLLLHRDL